MIHLRETYDGEEYGVLRVEKTSKNL